MYFNLQVTKISGFAPPPHPTPCLLNTSEYCKKCDAAPLWPPQQPPVSRSPPCPPSCPPSHTRPAPPPLPLLKSTRSTTRPLLRAEMIWSYLPSCWRAASLLLNFKCRVHLLAHLIITLQHQHHLHYCSADGPPFTLLFTFTSQDTSTPSSSSWLH